MSDTESEKENEEPKTTKERSDLLFVANVVKRYPVILNKSKVPSVTEKKEKALKQLKKEFEQQLGKVTDVKKLLKQINNLKANVKKKTDPSITGNKTKKLSSAEKIMYEVMQGDLAEPNPVLHKVAGNVAVSIREAEPPREPHPSKVEKLPPPPLKRAKLLDKYETEETKHLSNSELQRLVLLEQLTVIRLNKEKLQREPTT